MPRERSVHPHPNTMDVSRWSIDDIQHRIGRGISDEDRLDFVHASDDIIKELFVTDRMIKKVYKNNPTDVIYPPQNHRHTAKQISVRAKA